MVGPVLTRLTIPAMADAASEVEGWPFWAPSDERAVEAALDLAGVGSGDRVADLGCGDGHVLVRAAQRGATVVGVEADPELAEQARQALEGAGLDGTVVEGDLFDLPLGDLDVIFTYLAPVTLQQLVPHLAAGKAGARVVTVDFPIPAVRPGRVVWPCHLYRLPLQPKRAAPPGWGGAGVLVAAPPELESLTTLTFRAAGGPVVVSPSAELVEAAAVRVGAEEARTGTEVAVDLRWSEMPAGTVVSGRLTARGAGSLAVFALATPDEHGQWELERTAVRRLQRRLASAPAAPAWAELLAACEGDG